MGSICAGQGVILISDPTNRRSSLSHKLEMSSPIHSEAQESFFAEYKLHANQIGFGDHGEVWLCNKKTNDKLRAVKIINKAELPSFLIEDNLILCSVHKLKSLKNKYFPKIFKAFDNRNAYYIVCEYIRGGDLFDIMEIHGHMLENQTVKIVFQLLSAISVLHDNQSILNDVKPENILFTDVNNLIIKYNHLNFLGLINDFSKNSHFLSPEVKSNKFCEKSDSWSIGILSYYLLSGKLPDEGKKNFGLKDIPAKFFEETSSNCKDFIERCLDSNKDSRIGIKEALTHSWIISNTSDDLEIID